MPIAASKLLISHGKLKAAHTSQKVSAFVWFLASIWYVITIERIVIETIRIHSNFTVSNEEYKFPINSEYLNIMKSWMRKPKNVNPENKIKCAYFFFTAITLHIVDFWFKQLCCLW